ncbi:glycosyltransferase family 2 protein [Nocardia terpenica]|nr:glycosyltransferase family 2 protein [Nocardia terpenica]
MTAPLLSVIIPVYARRDELTRLLNSLAAQSPRSGSMEVVVVENREMLNRQWLSRADYPFPVRHEFAAEGNQSLCRNLGAEVCAGDVLLFVDSDIEFAAGALAVLRDCSLDDPERIVLADVLPLPGRVRSLGTYLYDVPSFFREYRRRARLGALDFRAFVSCGFAMSRSAFRAVGGFDSGFTHYGYEDVEFALRAQRSGVGFALCAARAFHHKALGPDSLLRRFTDLGHSAVHLTRCIPDVEDIMPVGVRAVRDGELSFPDDFDIAPTVAAAEAVERELDLARVGQGRVSARELFVDGRELYRRIALFGRFTGIRAELSPEPFDDRRAVRCNSVPTSIGGSTNAAYAMPSASPDPS